MFTKTVSSVEELIDHFGGPTKAAAALDAGGASVVWNWKDRGKLPTMLFLKHSEILKAHGIEAPASLWFEAENAA